MNHLLKLAAYLLAWIVEHITNLPFFPPWNQSNAVMYSNKISKYRVYFKVTRRYAGLPSLLLMRATLSLNTLSQPVLDRMDGPAPLPNQFHSGLYEGFVSRLNSPNNSACCR
ncbi:hypothetical protein P1X15_13740 [Runella sp. MFBS21]|uniref:hypothetical protein n=1 Tax=Runella sp. MFBS21 TaxID=3034018 RepID=UPI0023F7B0C8|nr:hypothetical protein [Runella sp. MFBS21]MDF7818673.1 hypothetical protein [Runella sp. MFBS21]